MTRWTELEPRPAVRATSNCLLAPACPACAAPMMPIVFLELGPLLWSCSQACYRKRDVEMHTHFELCKPQVDDDLLPRRTPADECILEWERLATSAETAEQLDAFFSGANPEPTPPRVFPESSEPAARVTPLTRAAAFDARAGSGGSRASAPGVGFPQGPAPSFLEVCVRDVLARAPWPLTAFEVAREVLKGHPNRWASRSIEKKCSDLARRGVLREVDCEGLSPDLAPCWRYALVEAA
jgi:hypothetical protein